MIRTYDPGIEASEDRSCLRPLGWTKVALGQVFSENFGFPCQYTFHLLSTIIFTITRGWHNRPGVAAVRIASQTK
jgi:hypothetical protein